MKNKFALLAFLGIIAVSCHRENQSTGPNITITDPIAGDTISAGSGIHLMVGFKDDHGLHDVKMEVFRLDSGNVNLFTQDQHIDEKEYVFHHHIHPNIITGVVPARFICTGTNHNEVKNEKYIDFYIKP